MQAKSFLLGITTGLIGGAVAVLFATPQSGTQLRQNIASNTTSAKFKFQDMKSEVSSVKQSIVTLKTETKNNMPRIINELKDSISSFQSEIEPETLKLKQEIEALQNSIKEIEKNVPSSENKS